MEKIDIKKVYLKKYTMPIEKSLPSTPYVLVVHLGGGIKTESDLVMDKASWLRKLKVTDIKIRRD